MEPYILFNRQSLPTQIIHSTSMDPWTNQAIEEILLRQISEGQVLLYLWQNKASVWMGRNQNPWRECRLSLLEEDNVKLSRRISGGGAVFHDEGNLNFTFMTTKKLYNLERQFHVILEALKGLGLDAQRSGQSDLTIDGLKFSGNAFYLPRGLACHHGTLLIDTDLNRLTRYLRPPTETIRGKGIESRRSAVINLSQIRKDLTVETMMDGLKDSFVKTYGGTCEEVPVDENSYKIHDLVERFASWDWRYGETPTFEMTFKQHFPWGFFEINIHVTKGRIDTITLVSDQLKGPPIQKLSLSNDPFNKETLIQSFREIGHLLESNVRDDVLEWLNTREI
ncbi:MAG: lipoate--protein ligase [bacterium]|nr:MAG: lipoate--protein ligase [bacterium]